LIAYREASEKIVAVPVDGSSPARELMSGVNVIPCDWSVNGQMIYMSMDGGSYPSLEVFEPGNPRAETLAKFGAEPQFSPDGKWVAYIGIPMRDIFVQKFPPPGPHTQISTMPGSAQPRWSHDGKRIYFMQPDRKLMTVDFDGEKGTVSQPQVFAQTRVAVTSFGWFQYGVARDGRILVNSLPANNASPLTLIVNWPGAVR
jgi:dipeptidyl aminopeptidase/acylaminoacyl peptidase